MLSFFVSYLSLLFALVFCYAPPAKSCEFFNDVIKLFDLPIYTPKDPVPDISTYTPKRKVQKENIEEPEAVKTRQWKVFKEKSSLRILSPMQTIFLIEQFL